MDRRPGDPRVAVLPARRGDRLPGAGSGAADHRRRRDAATAPGWRRAIGDGWTAFDDNFEANLPTYLETLEPSTAGARADQQVLVGFQGDWLGDERSRDTDGSASPRAAWERWQAAGADGAIVLARTTEDVDALVPGRVERW